MTLKAGGHRVVLDEITGVICLDCWDQPDLESFYQGVDSNWDWSHCQSIAVANYELALDSEDLCQYNTLEVYSWTHYTPKMLLPVMKEARQRKTSPYLQKHFRSHSFLLLDTESFCHHVETFVPHVKNWLIIGGRWAACTHNRPLSLPAMMHLPYNFYVATWSIYESLTAQHLERDRLPWVEVNAGLFRLDNH